MRGKNKVAIGLFFFVLVVILMGYLVNFIPEKEEVTEKDTTNQYWTENDGILYRLDTLKSNTHIGYNAGTNITTNFGIGHNVRLPEPTAEELLYTFSELSDPKWHVVIHDTMYELSRVHGMDDRELISFYSPEYDTIFIAEVIDWETFIKLLK